LAGGKVWGNPHQDMNNGAVAEQTTPPRGLVLWKAEWDAEDRQFYARTRYQQEFQENEMRRDQTLLRLGLAPYKAAADELTWWGMLEWTTERAQGDTALKHEVTPLVRLFYKNALVEIGMSVSGRATFNYMFHYF